MTHTKHEQLAHLIRVRINQLEDMVNSAVKMQDTVSRQQEDEASHLDNVAQAAVDETILAQARKEINQLRSNLEWLDHVHGGECEECGCIIPLERLLAVPTTRLCVDCASQHENDD